MKKIVKYLLAFWIFFILLVLSMGASRHVFTGGEKINGAPKNLVVFLSTFLSNTSKLGENNIPQLIENSYGLKNGFTYTKNYTSSKDYLLVSSWDNESGQSLVKLVRIKDGKTLHKWKVDIDQINKDFNQFKTYNKQNDLTKETTYLQHPWLNPDGSLVFAAGGVYKVDKNSKYIWKNADNCHHSIEKDTDGNFWMCGINKSDRNAEKYQIRDESIKKIDGTTGKILFEKSVYEILMENGYSRGIFFINPFQSTESKYLDYSHLNDLQPVLSDSKYWKKGDLFISLRHQNLVFLYRPSSNKIIWSQNGPWLRQHDIDILDSSRISIFGNNVLDAKFDNQKKSLIDGHNVEYIFDFSTRKSTTPYNKILLQLQVGTYTEGHSKILENQKIFIEESNHGRLIFGTRDKVEWTYSEKADEKHISLFSWCRYITEEEYKKLTFVSKKKNQE